MSVPSHKLSTIIKDSQLTTTLASTSFLAPMSDEDLDRINSKAKVLASYLRWQPFFEPAQRTTDKTKALAKNCLYLIANARSRTLKILLKEEPQLLSFLQSISPKELLGKQFANSLLDFIIANDSIDVLRILEEGGWALSIKLIEVAIKNDAPACLKYLLRQIPINPAEKDLLTRLAYDSGNAGVVKLFVNSPKAAVYFYFNGIIANEHISLDEKIKQINATINKLYRHSTMNEAKELVKTLQVCIQSSELGGSLTASNREKILLAITKTIKIAPSWLSQIARYQKTSALNELSLTYCNTNMQSIPTFDKDVTFGSKNFEVILDTIDCWRKGSKPELPTTFQAALPLPKNFTPSKNFYSMRQLLWRFANAHIKEGSGRKNSQDYNILRTGPLRTFCSANRYAHTRPIAELVAAGLLTQPHQGLRLQPDGYGLYEQGKCLSQFLWVFTDSSDDGNGKWRHGLTPVKEMWPIIEKAHKEILDMSKTEIEENPQKFYGLVTKVIWLMGNTTPTDRGTGRYVEQWLALMHLIHGFSPLVLKPGLQLDCLDLTLPLAIYQAQLLDYFEWDSLPSFAKKYKKKLDATPEKMQLSKQFLFTFPGEEQNVDQQREEELLNLAFLEAIADNRNTDVQDMLQRDLVSLPKGWSMSKFDRKYAKNRAALFQHLSGVHQATIFVNAATHGNTKRLFWMLEENLIGINQAFSLLGGRSPLILASQFNAVEIVRWLVSQKEINVNHQDYDNNTALSVAIKNRHYLIAAMLLKAGARDHCDSQGDTALILSAADGEQNIVQLLLSQKKTYVNQKTTHNGNTALILAINRGHYGIAKRLLEAGAVDQSNKQGKTALMMAATKGATELVRLLLRNDDANLINHRASDGTTALSLAIQNRHYSIAAMLLRAGATDHCNSEGVTALILSAADGELEIVQLLLAQNRTYINHKVPSNGNTALILAINHGHYAIANHLLEAGAVDQSNMQGKTALMVAAGKGATAFVSLLLRNDANLINHRASDGTTALSLAIQNQHYQVVDMLLAAGAIDHRPTKDDIVPIHECSKRMTSVPRTTICNFNGGARGLATSMMAGIGISLPTVLLRKESNGCSPL